MSEHRHNYYVHSVKADFVPVYDDDFPAGTYERYGILYKRIEYEYMYCPCGQSAIRVPVVTLDSDNQA